jgi:hypothetical protein
VLGAVLAARSGDHPGELGQGKPPVGHREDEREQVGGIGLADARLDALGSLGGRQGLDFLAVKIGALKAGTVSPKP